MTKKHYHLLMLVGLMLAMLPAWPVPTSTYAQPTTTITLSTVDVGVAETAVIEARIACGVAEGCSAFTINLTFDRDMIRIHNAEFGPYLGDNVFGATNVVDNMDGTISLSGAALQPPAPGVDNMLFRLEVGGLFPGAAAIDVTNASVVAATGAEIPTSGSGTMVNVFETGKVPFFSPPEAWEVAFVTDRDGNPEIYAVNADGSGLRRLTDNEVLDGSPAWSPDGSLLAFHSQIDGGLDIYVMQPDGTGVTRLTDHPAADYQPAWSPDGTRIAFVSDRDGNADIWVINADGSNPQRITADPAQDQHPAWSPNGKQIAFVSNRGGTAELFLINADGSGQAQQISNLFGANGGHPAWKPDGNLLSLSIERDALTDIYTLMPTGQDAKRLTPEGDPLMTSTDWSPDGNFVLHASAQSGVDDIYVFDVARNYLFRVTEDAERDYDPDWRPAGKPGGLCLISTTRGDVPVRVGPGPNRGEFTRLPANQDFVILTQFMEADGTLWYELDKTQIAGHEAVNALWVRASDVDVAGTCGALAQGTPPPLIPGGGNTPGDGGWQSCGSCNTCGHPANECVTAPDGQCLWDPNTCGGPPPPVVTLVPGDDIPGIDPTCYFVNIVINLNSSYGSVALRYPPDCGNGYSAGFSQVAVANPAPGRFFVNWAGTTCPGSPAGDGRQYNFTITGNCTLVANFQSIPTAPAQ